MDAHCAGRPIRRAVAALSFVALVAPLPAAGYPRPGRIELASVAADGTPGDQDSTSFSISGDGRFVAFTSFATNLVPTDQLFPTHVYVYDRHTGATERVSVASDGSEGNGPSTRPAISADGRFVAFQSFASNLAAGDTNGLPDVFVHDRATRTTSQTSIASDGTEGDDQSFGARLSEDGRFVVFESAASNLVPGDLNGTLDLFVHDRSTGATERVSVASDGSEAILGAARASISGDGRLVAFDSPSPDLVPWDLNGRTDVFVHDRLTHETRLASLASDGTGGNGNSVFPSLSADGRYVAFYSQATNLVPGDANTAQDVFVYDLATGVTERVSVSSTGAEADDASRTWPIAINADGRYIAFYSLASNLAAGDGNDSDVFLRDRLMGSTERVAEADSGEIGNAPADWPAIDASGRYVAFSSSADNLIPGVGGASQVMVRDRGPSVGILTLSPVLSEGRIDVSGSATLAGAIAASVHDPLGDTTPIGGTIGADLTGAEILHRPEGEDLLVRLHLSALPSVNPPHPSPVTGPGHEQLTGTPGILYAMQFTADGTPYELRALRVAADAADPLAPRFALFRCASSCERTATLEGSIGTTATDVMVSVPLEALAGATSLTDMRVTTAVAEPRIGTVEMLDEVTVPDAALSRPTLELGLAEGGTPGKHVELWELAALAEGRFAASLDPSRLPPGDVDVWARACLGHVCGTEMTRVSR